MTIQDDERRDRYEDRLLTELRALAIANAAAGAPERPPRRARPRLALAGVAGGACAATAAFALVSGDEGSTAYAVEPHGDGTVTVEIRELQDAAGLERKLREHGVPVEVDYLPPGQSCREPRFAPARRNLTLALGLSQREDGSVAFTVDNRRLAPGETLVIMSSVPEEATVTGGAAKPARESLPAARGAVSIAVAVAQGEVAPCEPVDAPAGPVETVPDAAAPRGGAEPGAGASGTSERAD